MSELANERRLTNDESKMKNKGLMNTRWILILAILFVTGSFVLPGQDWETITVEDMTKEIKSIEDFYKGTSAYSIKVTHKTFKNYTTSVMEDQSNGYFIKDAKNNYHSFAMNIRTVQNGKIKITIDSLNQNILISEPDKSFTKEVKVSELKDLLKVCSKIKKMDSEETDKYRFEFEKSSTYSAYEIWTNSDHRIKKLVLFFSIELPSDPDDEKSAKTKPRAEIDFSNYKTGITPVYKTWFDETKYVILKNGIYEPTEKYKKYIVYNLKVE